MAGGNREKGGGQQSQGFHPLGSIIVFAKFYGNLSNGPPLPRLEACRYHDQKCKISSVNNSPFRQQLLSQIF